MLLQDYRDFLKNCGRSENTVKIYTRKLQGFLDDGFSEADLIGANDLDIVVRAGNDNVFGLEVIVNDSFPMNIGYGLEQLHQRPPAESQIWISFEEICQ